MKDLIFTYLVKNSIYVNLTNRCPCSCTFCVRRNADGVFGSGSLWLEREPAVDELKKSIDAWNLDQHDEIVFCGYGEPTERLEDLLTIAKYIRSKSAIKIRINTNGLGNLVCKRNVVPDLQGLIDAVSISMNASNEEDYLRLTRSKFGIESFDAVLEFAKSCVQYVPNVIMTVVDVVTTPEEQEKCRKICENIGVKFRIRPFEK